MPELKQIEASVELGSSNTKLKEYGARYSDGHVETFVAVPDTYMPFSIHITTKGYIAPGISFFVFMDGEYQCNRNRIGLKLPGEGVPAREYETEFRLRQKEEKTSNGSFVAREWSFAKLNTVAADKAPSLNADFVRNVGTIEIVAMRCRPSSEDSTPRRATSEARKPDAAPKASSAVPKAQSAKKPTPAPSKAPSNKAAPAEEDMGLGGMFGLFDGACDKMGLDGANDERPVLPDGSVDPRPGPGLTWDAYDGKFQRQSHFSPDMPGAFPEVGADDEPSANRRIRAMIADELQGAQHGQLDGPGDWQRTRYGGGYGGPRRDDLRGDHYLGMIGQDRSDYKQFFKARGGAVSTTARPVVGIGIMDGFVCNTQAAAEQIKKAPPHAKDTARFFAASEGKGYYVNSPAGMRLLTGDLERVRQDLVAMSAHNPRTNTTDAWRDWHLMEAKLQAMGPGRHHEHSRTRPTVAAAASGKHHIYDALQDALDDIHLLREKLRLVEQSGGGPQINHLLDRVKQMEDHILEDSLWSEPPPPNELDALSMKREQLRRRNNSMSEIRNGILDMNRAYNVDDIAQRIERVCEEGRQAGRRVAELTGKAPSNGPPADGDQKPVTPRHVNFRQGYDGGNSTQPKQDAFWANATSGKDDGWQEVGQSSWKPEKQNSNGWGPTKQPSTHEHFVGQKLNTANDGGWGGPAENAWGGGNQTGNAYAGSQAGSKHSQKNGWAGGPQQQQQGGWGDNQQNDSAWPAVKPASKAPSNNGGWGDQSGDQGGNTWAAQGSNKAASQGGGNAWNDCGSQHESKNNAGGGANANANAWDNGGGGGGGANWGAQSNKNQSKGGNGDGGWGAGGGDGGAADWCGQSNKSGGGWGNDAKQSNKGSSKSEAPSSNRSPYSSPKQLVKPYWKDWDKLGGQRSGSQAGPSRRHEIARDAYTYPAAKLPAVPEGRVASATHGVQTGRGAEYNHVCRRPVYIDTMEKPYAVFSFKYRSKDRLKKITGLNVKSVDEDVKAVQKQVQKDNLMQLPKDKLIERLMQSSGSKGGSQKAPSARGASSSRGRPASNANGWDSASKAKSAAGDGWGNAQANGGGGGWGGSNLSKSKKTASHGLGADNGGGCGWDGQNDAPANDPEADEPAKSASGSFQFRYDAYKDADGGTAAGDKAAGNDWEQKMSTDIYGDPDAVTSKARE